MCVCVFYAYDQSLFYNNRQPETPQQLSKLSMQKKKKKRETITTAIQQNHTTLSVTAEWF